MSDFGVLNNRKRALIALIHSVVFLGVATHGFLSPKAEILGSAGATSDFVLLGISGCSFDFGVAGPLVTVRGRANLRRTVR